MAEPGWHRPVPLTTAHVLTGFSCGKPELDEWLLKRALANQVTGASHTHVVTADGRVVGDFALRSATIARSSLRTARQRRHMPDPVPGVLLARLAVDERHAGRGLGSALLREAIWTAQTAGQKIGIVFLLVHALDEEARDFYLHHDFELSPSDPLHLILMLKDLPPLSD